MTVVALDVGGSTVRGALVDPAGTLLVRHTTATGDRDPGLRATRATAERLLGEAERRGVAVAAIGAGFCEYVAPDGLLSSHEVLDWDVQPIELLGGLGPTPVVESDVRCGALGELSTLTDASADFAFVSVGTGLSYALVSGGAVRRGVRGEAIALGTFPVPVATAGSRAVTLEEFASGAGIARRYAATAGRPAPDGARSVVELAAQGDGHAEEVLTSAGRALGEALAQLVGLLDPGELVLGGGLGASEGLLRDALLASYFRATARRPGAPPIRSSTLGADAGLIGAAHLAMSVI